MDDTLLLSIFTAVEGAHAFSAFMPSYFTIKKFVDPEDVRMLRSGYAPAIFFNLVLGTTVTAITKKALPLIVSVIIIVFMLCMYESAIRTEVKNA
jgi:hypothetical protein